MVLLRQSCKMCTHGCPCGFYGDPKRECRCTPTQIQKYRNKISGPLLDRIDIHVEVPAIAYEELTSLESGETSADVRSRTMGARAVQADRFKALPRVHCNAEMDHRTCRTHCTLDGLSSEYLRTAMTELDLSARAYDRILRVSRTIADLAGSEAIQAEHVAEAIQYRTLDRQLWV